MRTLRSRTFLRCFYCGRKSNVWFEGQKSFDCSSCDATNWLDQDGEITDPPASEESLERSHLQYAIPRSSAIHPSSPEGLTTQGKPTEFIFCTTCLRNQHMLNSSLAQFEWPDDPTSAEYIARERKYWALKKDLEKRYPQVCEECRPKVNQKLHQASYTAQTDHLRRMMDRTRIERKEVKRRGVLDFIEILGKLAWYAGFALQSIWHLVVLSFLLTEPYTATEGGSWMSAALDALHRISAFAIPHTDRLMQCAINLGVCSFPWNPRFKQTIRGFTAHILGFRQWYTYQLLILLMRFVALSIMQYSKSQGLPISTQLGAQLVIPLLMGYIFQVARKSIYTDTTPLFRQPSEVTSESYLKSNDNSGTRNPNDLGNVLDEILQSSAKQQDQTSHISPQQMPSYTTTLSPDRYRKGYSAALAPARLNPTIEGLQLSEPVNSQNQEPSMIHYDEEMDWSPSASQHRAFSSYNPYKVKNTNPRFSDTPTEPKSGPIWYKVPPAPTNPAQRLRNPPMRPIIRESPRETKENFFQTTGRRPVDLGSKAQTSSADLNLAEPKFYAPQPRDDPRDGLSSIFANSFSISPSPEEQGERIMQSTGTANPQAHGPRAIPNRFATRVTELAALLVALGGWIFALDSGEHYGRSVALACICVCLIVSVRLAADIEVDYQIRGDRRPSVFAPSFANLTLAQVIIILLLMWNIWSGSEWVSSGLYGNTLFGSTIVHHMWHIFS
ncbi:hypothetical protein F5Y19DRAFT_479553 [Xylariaceae sp. FL1651]|nr:hypothetical protein F5Y19DRAFT_479553 [Xylariaceae sp. FL1651]